MEPIKLPTNTISDVKKLTHWIQTRADSLKSDEVSIFGKKQFGFYFGKNVVQQFFIAPKVDLYYDETQQIIAIKNNQNGRITLIKRSDRKPLNSIMIHATAFIKALNVETPQKCKINYDEENKLIWFKYKLKQTASS